MVALDREFSAGVGSMDAKIELAAYYWYNQLFSCCSICRVTITLVN